MLLTLDMDGVPHIAFKGDIFSRQPLANAEHLIRHGYKAHSRRAARAQAEGRDPYDAVLSRTVVQNVLSHLAAEAMHERAPTQHFKRVCSWNGACCIDLGQKGYGIARVTAEGVTPFAIDADVPFVRPKGMLPMLTPKKMPGVMAELRDLWANLSDDDYRLVVLFMLSCLWPSGRYAVLVIFRGETDRGSRHWSV